MENTLSKLISMLERIPTLKEIIIVALGAILFLFGNFIGSSIAHVMNNLF